MVWKEGCLVFVNMQADELTGLLALKYATTVEARYTVFSVTEKTGYSEQTRNTESWFF